MATKSLGLVAAATLCLVVLGSAQESDFSEINPDGSFSFGLKTNDLGGHYHEATGSPKSTVRGRFGSRNAENGRIEETVYTAGRRGFRARGPSIHRRMDLSQVPRGPIGTPEDPQADPFEDPSYGFGFKTPSYSRREDQDRFARLNGMYSYVDDVGERHLVRYSGSSQNGFDVSNSFPDAPQNVHYSRSLYKDPNPRARGRIAMQRKNNGQYSFIASAPDHRRSESIGPDGITRGSYSYLDDKGLQRTVQYIAGAGIGYRVVQTITGPGTHNLPRPSAPQFGVFSPQSNDLPPESLFFDDTPNPGFSKGPPATSPVAKSPFNDDEGYSDPVFRPSTTRGGKTPPYDENDVRVFPTKRPGSRGNRRPLRPFEGLDPNAIVPEVTRPLPPTPTPPSPPRNRRPVPPNNYDLRPTVTPPYLPHHYPEYFGVNSIDFDKANIRAHVQNIDLLPISPRYPSPGDALKWDIISGH